MKIRKQKAGIFPLTKQMVLKFYWRWIETLTLTPYIVSFWVLELWPPGYPSPTQAFHPSGSWDPKTPSWIHGWERAPGPGSIWGPQPHVLCQELRSLSLWQALLTKAAAGPRWESGMFDAQSWASELLSFRKHFLCHFPLAPLEARWPSFFLFCECTSLSLFSLPRTSCHLSSFSSFRCHFLRVAPTPWGHSLWLSSLHCLK